MRKSARLLGEEYGLTSQEMNYILKKEGYIDGEAGGYTATEKGAPYAEEKDYHRGTGGYNHYNACWTVRTWDDSIEEKLNITDDMVRDARNAVSEARSQRWDEIKAARAEADAKFLERYNQNDTDNDNDNDNFSDDSSEHNFNLLKNGLIIGGLVVLGYGVYKAVPRVVKWWKGSITPKLSGTEFTSNNNLVKKMICPSCSGTMKFSDDTTIWKCEKCNYITSEVNLLNGEVFWFCNKCEAFLNIQQGFTTGSGHWTCSKCGLDNDITDINVKK